MAEIITLEDGRALYASSLGISSMLHRIAEQLVNDAPRLAAWLSDKSDRPSPFCGFDVRGLTEDQRKLFWQAARNDFARRIEMHGPPETWGDSHYSGFCLQKLLQMQDSICRGEPPEALNDLEKAVDFDGEMENLSDLWSPVFDSEK